MAGSDNGGAHGVRKNEEEEQKTCFSIFHDFAEETTLHGIREISKYWTVLPLRIFFIICQFGIYSVLTYHMYLVISQFIAEPVLVQTVTTSDLQYKYPSLTFCPQLWLNVSRYEEVGITRPALLYALSLMKRIVIVEKVHVESAKKELGEFMDKNNISTFYELYILLANDYTNESMTCAECSYWPPKKVITEEGVCYHFKFNDWTPNYLVDNPPKITYSPVKYPNTSIYDAFHTIDYSEYLAVGMHPEDYLALDPIFVLVNHSYFLRVTPTNHKLLDDDFTPCVAEPNDTTPLMCKAFCRQEIRDSTCDLATVLGYIRKSSQLGPHWNGTPLLSSLDESANDYYKAVLQCNKKVQHRLDKCESEICPPWCDEMTYSTSIQTVASRRIFEDLPEAAMAVIIDFEVRAGVVEVLEQYSYTWYSFLSDVGGLIGLWCGASVVSIIPLATFFFDNCIFLSRRKWIRKRLVTKRNQFANAWRGAVANRHEMVNNHMMTMVNGVRSTS